MINPYASLDEFKVFNTARSQTATVDAADDSTIEKLIEGVSRYIDDRCHRTFYPRYEKRYFDVPILQNSPRNLFLDDDLLEEVTVTNGDSTVVSSTRYNLKPKNYSPHYAIQLIGPSQIFWIFNGIGSVEKVISVEGWWGFHNQYAQRAWTAVDTLGAAITDTTSKTFTLTDGSVLLANDIFKIDSEIFNAASIGTKAVTVNQRGDNGSTAATHLNGATLYRWQVQPEIKNAVLMIVQNIYSQKSGQSAAGKVTVTAAGVVIRPEDVPPFADQVIRSFIKPVIS